MLYSLIGLGLKYNNIFSIIFVIFDLNIFEIN